jgi:predicted metal-binding membrane protein
MALLFVGGAMNLLWIAALTLLVAIEKLAPKGDMIAKALGALMIGAGVARLAWQFPCRLFADAGPPANVESPAPPA